MRIMIECMRCGKIRAPDEPLLTMPLKGNGCWTEFDVHHYEVCSPCTSEMAIMSQEDSDESDKV